MITRREFIQASVCVGGAPEEAKTLVGERLREIKMIPQSDGSYLACGE
jgi:hypothetical protein